MSDEKEPMMDHEYDGIRELDNALPAWWIATFVGTVIFGCIYFVHYTTGAGLTSDQELAASMEVIKGARGSGPSYTEEGLGSLFNPENVKAGQAVFVAKCAACHGPDGGGVIGPNLTDDSWINGKGTRVEIVRLISEGVVAKGMPAWGELMPREELVAVASYVYSIVGTNVPGGKPPQGNKVP